MRGGLGTQPTGTDMRPQAINPQRREEKQLMKTLGIKTKKAFRKWQKKTRRRLREQDLTVPEGFKCHET
jgi:hypothetical protein